MERHCTTYSWRVKMPAGYEATVTSNYASAKVIANCAVYVTIRWVEHNRVIVQLVKTKESPFQVDITAKLCNFEEKSINGFQWRRSCEFMFTGNLLPLTADRVLHIVCEVLWELPSVIPPPPTFHFPEEMQAFLMNQAFSDVVFAIGDEEIPAHKLILVSNSPVFLRMLSTPMEEAQTNRVEILDIPVDIMKVMLTFLYTGRYQALEDVDVACRVLAAAQKYDIGSLKDVCEYSLFTELEVENALKILEYAEVHKADRLKQECWRFVIRNKREIITTEQFRELCLRNTLLMDQFMEEIVKADP
ncbi:speckle-type POZ protein A [Diachasma alloeum]|uniref:speckle-type POZ protein A n=1 Tax=Diachasma alloeum TaxID=454923 RepID=UPI000738375F|nr:speckle-type POZ protein A [Diachasma alloeum]